jgi:guanylate kinase
VDYRFVDEATFADLVKNGQIFEYQRKYGDHLYGTPRSIVTAEEPNPLVVVLDGPGFLRVRTLSARRVIGIHVLAASVSALHDRLIRRDTRAQPGRTDDHERQTPWAWAYDYVVVNDGLDAFLHDLEAVVRAELIRRSGLSYLMDREKGSP